MKVFLIGMSGIGMQGLAAVLKQSGYEVFGHDDLYILDNLKSIGVQYTKEIPENTNYIIYSSGIKENHFLMQEAKIRNIPCINRTEFWVDHFKLNENLIAISGCHGKTLTTAMLAYILGKKSYMLGGIINKANFAAHHTHDKFSVIEADESDGSFLYWRAKYKILLNFDFDHMDFYKTKARIIEYYRQFAMDEDSTNIICARAKEFLDIPDASNIITFGNYDADFIYHDIEYLENVLKFKINGQIIELPCMGEYNASNFTAIYALLKEIKMPHISISEFPGVKKRMEIIKQENDKTFWLDYGHHPTEIKAVLESLYLHKKAYPCVILEIHRYARLMNTWHLWPETLKGCKVFITKINTLNETIEETVAHEATLKFIEFLKENNIQAEFLNKIEDYEFSENTICFSSTHLSRLLSK